MYAENRACGKSTTRVEQVKVLFNASKVKVNVQSGTDPATLKQAIEHLGYEVEAIKVKELV